MLPQPNSWLSLEPNQDEYNFTVINYDLKRVNSKGKKLWAQLKERTFNISNDPVASYMRTPCCGNGSAPTCDGKNCSGIFEKDGWMAMQWKAHVRIRFQALLAAGSKDRKSVV